MSARNEIFKRLAGAYISEDRANALIDAFTHELAEQIRNHQFHPGAEPYDGADLIDPEVS